MDACNSFSSVSKKLIFTLELPTILTKTVPVIQPFLLLNWTLNSVILSKPDLTLKVLLSKTEMKSSSNKGSGSLYLWNVLGNSPVNLYFLNSSTFNFKVTFDF